MKIVMVAGHFDPAHKGHIDHMRKASELGSVIVVVGSDAQIKEKYGFVMKPLHERIQRIFKKAPFIQGVVVSIDKDSTSVETLKMIRPQYFAKGGDRIPSNMPRVEIETCKEIGCEIVYGVQGVIKSSTKIRSRILRFQGK